MSMLAFSYVPVLEKSDYKVISLAASERVAWIGSSEARIVLYAIETADDDGLLGSSASLLSSPAASKRGELWLRFDREVKAGAQATAAASKGKKGSKVKQLEYVASLGLLLSLCNGAIEVWNAYSMQPASPVPLAENAGVKLFAVDHTPKAERIAVLTKKTAWVFAMGASRQWVAVNNVALPEEVVACALSSHTLAIATPKAYALIDVRSGKVTELFAYSHAACVCATAEGEFVLAQERLGLVVNAQGVAARSTLTFAAPPSHVLVAAPYVLALQPSPLGVEVHDQHASALLQTLPCRLGSDAAASARLCAVRSASSAQSLVFVYAAHAVAALKALPLKEQVAAMLSGGDVKRGLELYMRSGRADADFKAQLKRFHSLAGDAMLKRADFAAAFAYYKTADVAPLAVLAAFPELTQRAGIADAAARALAEHAPLEQGRDVAQLAVRALYEDARRAAGQREHAGKEAAQLVDEAKRQLLAYLEFACAKHKKEPAVRAPLDRALTLLAAELGAPEFRRRLADLAQQRLLHVDDLARLLEQQQRWSALALLSERAQDTPRALGIWERLANGSLRDSALSASAALSEIVKALTQATSWPLLQQYTPWLSQQPQGVALLRSVYLASARDKDALPHAEVVATLKRYAPPLEQPYLEHVVDTLGVRERRFHVQLSALYLQAVLRVQASTSPAARQAVDQRLAQEWTPPNAKTRDTPAPAASSGGQGSGSAEEEAYLSARRVLLRFLQRSELYEAGPLVAHLERATLREELLVALTRLGEHERALAVLLRDMKDMARAERFCAAWRPEYVRGADDFAYDAHTKAALDYHSAPTGVNPYLQSLFKLYLDERTPTDAPDELPERARELLAKHGARLDAVAVLQQCPVSVPLSQLSAFLAHATQRLVHRGQATQITRHVESAQNMAGRLELLHLQQAHAVLARDAVCPVKGTRIHEGGAFLRFPNGVVTSNLAAQDYPRHICPLSGRDFRLDPMGNNA